jgi:hypothetical protein
MKSLDAGIKINAAWLELACELPASAPTPVRLPDWELVAVEVAASAPPEKNAAATITTPTSEGPVVTVTDPPAAEIPSRYMQAPVANRELYPLPAVDCPLSDVALPMMSAPPGTLERVTEPIPLVTFAPSAELSGFEVFCTPEYSDAAKKLIVSLACVVVFSVTTFDALVRQFHA